MKNTHAAAALSALLVTTAFSAAHADERWPRWYLGLSGGYTYMQDQDISGTSATRLNLKDGYNIGGQIGYLPNSSIALINTLRFEAEVTYRANNVDSVTGGGAGHGTYSSTAYMANMFYDLPTATAWSPYIGGGIGLANLHLDSNSGAGNTDSGDDAFAYQGMVGIGYSPEAIPNTQWTLGYRYFATNDPKFGNVSTEYSTQNVELGAKFRF